MAKSVKALITPEVFKWAREKRIKLSLDYAAKKLDVKPDQLEKWEAGTDQPCLRAIEGDRQALQNAHLCFLFAGATY